MKQLDVIEVAPYLAADTNKLRTKIVSLYRKLLQLYGDDIKNLILSDTTFSATMQLLLSEDVILLVKSLDDEFKTEEATKVITISNEVLKIAPQKINMNTNCKPSMLETSYNKASEKLASLGAKQDTEQKATVEEKQEPGKTEQAHVEEKEPEPEIEKDNIEFDAGAEKMIDTHINNIMKVYDSLYRSLFLSPPAGVIFFDEKNKSGGALKVQRGEDGKGVKVVSDDVNRRIYRKVYKGILDGVGDRAIRQAPKVGEDGMSIDTSWMNPDGTMTYNYMPYMQIRNCNGIYRDKNTQRLVKAQSYSDFRKILQANLKVNIKKLLKRIDINNDAIFDRALESIKSLYTTVIIANEFDTTKSMRFTMSLPDIKGLDNRQSNQISQGIINANPLGMSLDQYKLMNSSVANNIVNTLIVTDEKRYKGELLFAYKLIGKLMESGASVNLKNAVVGTKINGDSYSVNLADTANTIISVIAGSGSGKGVLTLALLSYMIAARSPVVYVDYKPDMAKALWDMKNSNNGVGILAVDGAGGGRIVPDANGELKALEPGWGANPEVKRLMVGNTNTIPYVKAIQLMNLVARYRVDHNELKKAKAFFVLDEAQKAGQAIADTTKALEEKVAEYKKELKKDASEEQMQNLKDLKRVVEMFKGCKNALDTFQKTNGRSGNMSAIVLGQAPEANSWPGMFYSVISGSPLRFLGSGTYSPKGGTKAGVGQDVEGATLLGRGYFAVATSTTSSKDNTTVIKTAMVLNDADGQDGPFVGSLLTNVPDDIKDSVIEDDIKINENNVKFTKLIGLGEDCIGQDNPLVGFPGLIKYLGAAAGAGFDINAALKSGEDQLEAVLKKLGIISEDHFQSVESYLYSARADSIFTNGELQSALVNNINIYEYVAGNTGEESDFSGDGAKQAIPGEILEANIGEDKSTTQMSAGLTPETTFISDDDYKSQHSDEQSQSQTEKTTSDNGPVFISDDDYKSQFKGQDTQSDDSGATFISDDDYKSQFGEQTDTDDIEYPDDEEPKVSSEDKQLADENIRKMNEMLQQLEKTGKLFDEADLKSHMDDDGYRKYNELRQQQEEVLQQIKTVTELARVGLMRKNEEPSFNINSTNNVVINNYNSPELQGHVAPMSAAKHIFTGMNMGIQSMHSKLSLMRNPSRGTEQIFKELIQHIKTVGVRVNTAGYLRVANQENGNMQVGNRLLDYKGFTNANNLDINTVRPSDIVSLNVIAKEFKTLNRLELDNPSLMKVYSEINKSGKTNLGYPEVIERIFKRIPSLVEFTYSDSSGQKQTISRMDLSTNKAMVAIDRLEKQNLIVSRLEAASLNRGDGNGTSRKVRAAQTVAYMKAAGIAQGTPKKLAKIGGTTAVAATVGLVFGPVFAVGAGLAGLGFGIKTLVNLGKQGGGTSSKSADKDE